MATIGVAALCAQWFTDIGLQEPDNELGVQLRADYLRIVDVLSACFDGVVAPGIISTIDGVQAARAQFRQADVDAIVLLHIMWSEDQPLLALLEDCDVPLILWDYHPTGNLPPWLSALDLLRFSGTVGMLQGSAPLQRLGRSFELVSGTPGDDDLAAELRECARALDIRRAMHGMTVGRIAGRCDVMTGTFVNATALADTFDMRLVEISASAYAVACQAVSAARINDMTADLTGRYPIDGVSETTLQLACRNTLALDDLVEQHNLSAVALQDLDEELHRLAIIRPCLCPPRSAARGVPFAMESDLNTALAMRAAMALTGQPCLYAEIFTSDPAENLLLMGHAGVHDPRLAADGAVTIVPDYEYYRSDPCEGAWLDFIVAAGPVTCASLYDTGAGYRMTLFEGESIGAPRRLQGYAHALVRPDVHVRTLLPSCVRRGLTQHFAVAPGHIAATLARWCSISGIACVWERAG